MTVDDLPRPHTLEFSADIHTCENGDITKYATSPLSIQSLKVVEPPSLTRVDILQETRKLLEVFLRNELEKNQGQKQSSVRRILNKCIKVVDK